MTSTLSAEIKRKLAEKGPLDVALHLDGLCCRPGGLLFHAEEVLEAVLDFRQFFSSHSDRTHEGVSEIESSRSLVTSFLT